ncbi:hypothetical protein [Actinomadura parmotrematis]|uniref:VWA domain-containing protein n=1 Tax=Actinomadura parmotrematis TaxID=2864039 RepID=A0ABS7FQS2_9ACTN|nr:hypothetical protein [Actinomadura parmotrematis]MBW8482749.1 hypothetical protein [Actinomadura parmotrematis]
MDTPGPIDTPGLLAHLHAHGTPLTLPRGGTLCWDDAGLHRAAHRAAPERYALLSLTAGTHPWQRARTLLQILAASQAGLDAPTRATLAATARVLTLALPPATVLTTLLALRRLRANHKHTTRAILRFVLEHPDAPTLIATRRTALLDCYEHALGTSTARHCARRIAAGDTGSPHLQRRLLRFLTPAPPPHVLTRVTDLYTGAPDAPPTACPPPDPLRTPPLADADLNLDTAAPFHGTLALVLDTTRHPEAPGTTPLHALAHRLTRLCPRLHTLHTPDTGNGEHAGNGENGRPDLNALLHAARAARPDLIAVLTDRDTPQTTGPPHPAVPEIHYRLDADGLPDSLPAPAALPPWLLAHCTAGADWLHTTLRHHLDDLDSRLAPHTAPRP